MPKKQDTTVSFIEKAKKKHGNKFDYSLVDYKKTRIKIKIICSKHGIFEQQPGNHLMGKGCDACAKDHRSGLLQESNEKRRRSASEFIQLAKKVHGDRYGYLKVDYKSCRDKVIIICEKHGEYLQEPRHHLSGSGCGGCVADRNFIGKNELELFTPFLETLGFEFATQYAISSSGFRCYLDFYLPNENIVIEYDERYHKEEKRRKKDKIRDKKVKEILKCRIIRVAEEEFLSEPGKIKEYLLENLIIEENYARTI